ncbi:MAG: YggS family pyridoxal phosphate-dependent enzyme [Acidobacteria bacterium]|nr:YggS family pyridoxal phosphate-dependent enzyme [Acidobacteriota bacterium]
MDMAANVSQVLERIAGSAVRAGRDPASVRLIAVTKTLPPERVQEAYQCGLREFGENRVQEFHQKLPHLHLPEARFHLIGHLQSNKVHQAMAFDWVQTVDSERLALRLQKAAAETSKTVPVLIQVNLGEEVSKSGISESDLPQLVTTIGSLDRLDLRGLMTIPPYADNPERARPYFHRLRQLRDQLLEAGFPQVQELSMGMSHDFEVAIEEGATMVRIGTAIFGPRNPDDSSASGI